MVITHNVLMVLMQTEDGLTSNCIHECWINFVCSRLYGNNDLWIIIYLYNSLDFRSIVG